MWKDGEWVVEPIPGIYEKFIKETAEAKQERRRRNNKISAGVLRFRRTETLDLELHERRLKDLEDARHAASVEVTECDNSAFRKESIADRGDLHD